MKLDNFVPFGRPQSGTVIIQLVIELDVSNNYRNSNTTTVEKAKQCAFFKSKNSMSQGTYFENIYPIVV